MQELYNKVCEECSELITKRYSTSFSMGIRIFDKKLRAPIYSIYGFVRFTDEIVDTFHDQNKAELLDLFEQEVYLAIEKKISLNPILQSFQKVVHRYQLEIDHIKAFFESMRMDLEFKDYVDDKYNSYIYGSAEVIGLMCLKVFLDGDEGKYEDLKESAMRLGSAFQKVNFLRDIKSDFQERGRVYFPGVDYNNFSTDQKSLIESNIQVDFDLAIKGIKSLPRGSRWGVYLAFIYYVKLFKKIKKASPGLVKQKRLRINDGRKIYLLFQSFFCHRLNWF